MCHVVIAFLRPRSYDDTAVLKWVRYISRSGQYEIRY